MESASIRIAFDRGTLVVQGPPDALGRLAHPGLVWDGRTDVHRALACRHEEVLRQVLEAGLDVRDEVRCGRGERLEVAAQAALRGYQEDALLAWELAGRRGLVVLPTGAGKTRVALGAIARLGESTLVLVPTRVLLEQWTHVCEATLGVRPSVYGDGDHEVGPLTVCTFESAFRHMDEFGDRFALLVVDEAHHFAGPSSGEALEMCAAPARLGLTATPPAGPDGRARLESLVGPIVFQLQIADLAGTHLAPFDHVLLRVDLTPDERAAYEELHAPCDAAWRLFRESEREGGYDRFVRALLRSPGGRDVLAGERAARRIVATARAKRSTMSGLANRHRDARVLVFTADNAAAYAVSRDLLAPAVTCDIGRKERSVVLDRFREGTYRLLVSARVLNEGLDVPEASVGVVLGGSLGPGEHVQRVGRLLRPGPDKVARVYEVVVRDTFEDLDSIRRRRGLRGDRGAPPARGGAHAA